MKGKLKLAHLAIEWKSDWIKMILIYEDLSKNLMDLNGEFWKLCL